MSGSILSLLAVVLLFAPFVFYVVMKQFFGMKEGIIGSFIATAIACLVIYVLFDGLEQKVLVAVVLIFVLGTISLKTDEDYYFKLEPALKSAFTSLFLLWFVLIGDPVTKDVLSTMAESEIAMSSEAQRMAIQGFVQDPKNQSIFWFFELWLIFLGLAYGIFMMFVARKWSDVPWLIAKLLYFPLVFIPAFLFTMIMMIVRT
ncbi:MAG: hypothetical protein OXC40_04155 [Proteobacteria bacterium]|nr:hypothetical protein [Pseudomonadota bacterium]